MKAPAFDYCAPDSVEGVVKALAETDGAKIISGGQSFMPVLAFRLAAPTLVVDLRNVPGLDRIDITDDGTRLGARTRWVDIETSKELRKAQPLLCSAIDHVAHYQVRNRGTVGGSLCHADPAAEMPGVSVTCEAVIEILGSNGHREVAAADFFAGPLQVNLEEDEMILGVRLPAWPAGRRWAFEEFSRRRGDFALAGALVFYDVDAQNRISNAHVGGIGVGDTPIRVSAAEAALNGQIAERATFVKASEAARAAIEPMNDLHAPSDYRRDLYAGLLLRSLEKTIEEGAEW